VPRSNTAEVPSFRRTGALVVTGWAGVWTAAGRRPTSFKAGLVVGGCEFVGLIASASTTAVASATSSQVLPTSTRSVPSPAVMRAVKCSWSRAMITVAE